MFHSVIQHLAASGPLNTYLMYKWNHLLLQVSQASWAESAYKSNNLGVPDKAQVATRLTQIRDYVSQTESLMEGLRTAGGQVSFQHNTALLNQKNIILVCWLKTHFRIRFIIFYLFICANKVTSLLIVILVQNWLFKWPITKTRFTFF